MSERAAALFLRWTYCAFIAWSSVQTFLQARGGHSPHALILSVAELAAIAAFLVPAFDLAACTVLLIVYAIAAALTLAQGEMPLRFFYFAMTAVYLVVRQRSTLSANA